MNFENRYASCPSVRSLDLVSYLDSLGYQPQKIRNDDYWYCSPLRAEKTPSFKINRKLNRWYDHGMGKGGNMIDFAILYHHCTVGAFLQMVQHGWGRAPYKFVSTQGAFQREDHSLKITKVGALRSFVLLRYLYQRRIPFTVAKQYLQEVHYELNGQEYFAIGFQNNSGGYELRNSFFKGSSAPQDITLIKKNSSVLTVFEGFFDFLSFLSLYSNQRMLHTDFLVLNSTSFFEKALSLMTPYQVIHLYMDRDTTGQNCTRYALSLDGRFKDQSGLYSHYKDLNEWLTQIGKSSHLLP